MSCNVSGHSVRELDFPIPLVSNTDGMEKPSVRKPRLTRDERKLQTRADLLLTARRLFEERGFHGASLDDIADEAGYTKGAVYSNFASKDELFLAVLGDHIERRVRANVDAA